MGADHPQAPRHDVCSFAILGLAVLAPRVSRRFPMMQECPSNRGEPRRKGHPIRWRDSIIFGFDTTLARGPIDFPHPGP